jgi:hypothetical protein
MGWDLKRAVAPVPRPNDRFLAELGNDDDFDRAAGDVEQRIGGITTQATPLQQTFVSYGTAPGTLFLPQVPGTSTICGTTSMISKKCRLPDITAIPVNTIRGWW